MGVRKHAVHRTVMHGPAKVTALGRPLRLQRRQHAFRRERHVIEPLAGQLVEGIGDRRCHAGRADLAEPRRVPV